MVEYPSYRAEFDFCILASNRFMHLPNLVQNNFLEVRVAKATLRKLGVVPRAHHCEQIKYVYILWKFLDF